MKTYSIWSIDQKTQKINEIEQQVNTGKFSSLGKLAKTVTLDINIIKELLHMGHIKHKSTLHSPYYIPGGKFNFTPFIVNKVFDNVVTKRRLEVKKDNVKRVFPRLTPKEQTNTSLWQKIAKVVKS